MGYPKTIQEQPITPMPRFSDLTPQPEGKNGNKHTERGVGMLESTIQKDGWIGAITTAKDYSVFAGSARTEVAHEKFGDTEIVEIDANEIAKQHFGGRIPEGGFSLAISTNGSVPIAVVREDIPNANHEQARRLGHADNRVSEINFKPDWDVIESDFEEIDLTGLWSQTEVELGKLEDIEPAEYEPVDFKDPKGSDTKTIRIPVDAETYEAWEAYKKSTGIKNGSHALKKLLGST